ncbi:MAG: hypothetical protein ACJ8OJ_03345, partial [Povalibacter sp.]
VARRLFLVCRAACFRNYLSRAVRSSHLVFWEGVPAPLRCGLAGEVPLLELTKTQFVALDKVDQLGGEFIEQRPIPGFEKKFLGDCPT